MDVGTALSVVQTLLSAVQCHELIKVLSFFSYKSRLDDLKVHVEKINAVLRDAEAKQKLSQQDQNLVKKLKDAVFEADDLFDEFVTLAEQKKLRKADGSLSRKASDFFSLSKNKNKLSVVYRMSHGVKKIKKKLDAIAYNQQFNLNIDHEPIKNGSRETSSYVNKFEIIGREDDVKKIVGNLLDPNDDQRDVSVLSIVGIGGLGKTALAQLVYNDPRIKDAFPLRSWTCVSDQDQKESDVRSILAKILASITDTNHYQGSTLDQVQSKLRQQLAGKKYLLVLDDVWNEKRAQWCELVNYLSEEKRGSWIVVTTRSKETAAITDGPVHELFGLSTENSWQLFERTAFPLDQPKHADELVEIGKKIVDGCCGVPLAIRVVGSLLYNQNKSKWLSVQKIRLVDNDGIMPTLMLSFNQLQDPLKNCFRYCALFPKDYVIQKQMLISLWMAQGYIALHDEKQSIEDVGEEYFLILLKRCFFQDINENIHGEIMSCKIHDLMHDIAQKVSGKEMCALDNIKGNVDDNVRHLSISKVSEYKNFYFLSKTNIRSLLSFNCYDNFQSLVGALVKRFKYLRVLDLSGKRITHLPESIGELLHLRYIDLSMNQKMKIIPDSITKLCNLQTLILNDCYELKELPKGLSRLVKLRFLNIERCYRLRWMPGGMGKLTCLHALEGEYIVGGEERCTSWNQWLDGLENLKSLINLRGTLQIKIRWPKNAKIDVKEDRMEGLNLKSMEQIIAIFLSFEDGSDEEEDSGTMEDEERIRRRVMESLQPPSKLKRLIVRGYNGVKMPSWVTGTLLPHLEELHLEDFKELMYLPCLGNLCHLKTLDLEWLPKLEYLPCLGNLCHLENIYLICLAKLEYIEEEDSTMLASTSTTAQQVSFFPSLEFLQLSDLPKFQGWRRLGVGSSNRSSSNKQCFSQLKNLAITKCPELMSILSCPMLETLKLIKFNERLQIIMSTKTEERLREAVIEEEDLIVPKLGMVEIDNGAWFNSIPVESFRSLQVLIIVKDHEMEDLPNCIQHLSALEVLAILKCSKLKAMPNWMPKLTSLCELSILECSERLTKRCEKDPPGEDWPYIQHIREINLQRRPSQVHYVFSMLDL